jgi:uncharacterized membrane protein YuzA (DUF378 family)
MEDEKDVFKPLVAILLFSLVISNDPFLRIIYLVVAICSLYIFNWCQKVNKIINDKIPPNTK